MPRVTLSTKLAGWESCRDGVVASYLSGNVFYEASWRGK